MWLWKHLGKSHDQERETTSERIRKDRHGSGVSLRGYIFGTRCIYIYIEMTRGARSYLELDIHLRIMQSKFDATSRNLTFRLPSKCPASELPPVSAANYLSGSRNTGCLLTCMRKFDIGSVTDCYNSRGKKVLSHTPQLLPTFFYIPYN